MTRRFFVPEVIQGSAMDCGPAALKALFGGFGRYLSYGRLREACQTDVDGTSIDTLEDIADKLGLDVEQRMMPADVLLLAESRSVPSIVVVRLPGGATHFVVLWRVHRSLVHVMNPAGGRVWMHRCRFLESLYVHEQTAPRAAWDEWSRSAAFTAGLHHRMRALSVSMPLWADRGHLDASLRLALVLVDAGALKRGRDASDFLGLCEGHPEQIPAEYWFARAIDGDDDRVRLRGAVLLAGLSLRADEVDDLPDSLAAVRHEPPPRPWAPVFAAIRASGWSVVGIVTLALVVSACGTVLEVLLFRGLFDIARHLKLVGQRLGALAGVMEWVGALLTIEWAASQALLRFGRHVDLRLRTLLLVKIPRLSDRYFQSRLISDMAFRAHTLHHLRQLPELVGRFVRCGASLLCTAIAISWLYPGAALAAWSAVVAAVGVPLLFQPALIERDLRYREAGSALSRFVLDALLGSRTAPHGPMQGGVS